MGFDKRSAEFFWEISVGGSALGCVGWGPLPWGSLKSACPLSVTRASLWLGGTHSGDGGASQPADFFPARPFPLATLVLFCRSFPINFGQIDGQRQSVQTGLTLCQTFFCIYSRCFFLDFFSFLGPSQAL